MIRDRNFILVSLFGPCALWPALGLAQTPEAQTARAPASSAALPEPGGGLPDTGGGRPALTLPELLAAAKKNHPSLQKQAHLDQQRELERRRLSSSYYPRLSFGAQASWQSEVTEVDIPVQGVTVTPPTKDQYRFTLDLQQTIWDGGVTSDQKSLVDQRTSVERQKANVEWHQVRESVLGLYHEGVIQQELEVQAKALDAYVETLMEKTQLLVEQGLATRRDVLLLEAQEIEAKQAGIDAAQALVGVRASLQDLTGQTIAVGTPFAESVGECAPRARERPTAENVQRPELALLDAQMGLFEAQEEIRRAGDRPRLGAFATGGLGRPGLNFLSTSFSFYFIGGAQLTVPLTYLYAGTHRNGDKQVEVQRSLLAEDREIVMTRVSIEYDREIAELIRLETASDLDQDLLRVRVAAREQTELQVELGTSSTSELVDDLRRETLARSREAVHRAKRSLACHRIALIKGDL